MSFRTCDHLKEDGIYCSSPALRNQRYCYFHLNLRACRVQAAQARLHGQPCRLRLPILDNMHAVQSALQQVADALADDRIEPRRAGQLLYLLQQVACNLNRTPGWDAQVPPLEADQELRALEVPSLQEQYGLPFDTDLEAPAEVAAAAIDASAALPLDARQKPVRPAPARVPVGRTSWDDDPGDHADGPDPTYGNLCRSLQAAQRTLRSGPGATPAEPASAA